MTRIPAPSAKPALTWTVSRSTSAFRRSWSAPTFPLVVLASLSICFLRITHCNWFRLSLFLFAHQWFAGCLESVRVCWWGFGGLARVWEWRCGSARLCRAGRGQTGGKSGWGAAKLTRAPRLDAWRRNALCLSPTLKTTAWTAALSYFTPAIHRMLSYISPPPPFFCTVRWADTKDHGNFFKDNF